MADVKVLVAERAFNDLETTEEIDPSSDVILTKGMKTTAAELTFEDATEGEHPLTDLVNTNTELEDLTDIVFDSVGPQNGDLLQYDGSSGTWINIDPSTLDISDELVGISSNDTTPDYLSNKITAGTGISLTEINDGGDEDLQISADQLTLDDLTDIEYDSVGPVEGQVLVFNDSTGLWTPQFVGEGVPATQTWMYNAGQNNVATNGDTDLSSGDSNATGGIVTFVDAEIVALSITITGTQFSGTLTGYVTINGIAQNGAGETVEINGTNVSSDVLELVTPVTLLEGDILGLRVTTNSFTVGGGGKDVTMAAFIRNM